MEGVTNQFLITLEGIEDDSAGLALHELQNLDEVLGKISSVLAMYVRRSSDSLTSMGESEGGESEGWVHSPRLLELRRSASGCLSARWTLGPLSDVQSGMGSGSARAVESLLKSIGGRRNTKDVSVQDFLDEISDALPAGVSLLLGDSEDPNRIQIGHAEGWVNDAQPRDEALISDLHEIGLRSATLFGPGLSAVNHGDLLYDERGLPK